MSHFSPLIPLISNLLYVWDNSSNLLESEACVLSLLRRKLSYYLTYMNRLLTLSISGLFLSLMLFISACQGQRQATTGEHTNALIDATSPYLLQHAHNPVDWYPWGEEALEKAQEESKLLIISVGYAACHWCHVMENESFEDTVVAKLMNDKYVSIKVDREERPDIDRIYMNAAQLTTGRGGWPLNVIALPDGRPVFAGTYFPKENWMDLLSRISEVYTSDPQRLTQVADQITQGIQQMEYAELVQEKRPFSKADVKAAANTILGQIDMQRGGFQGAPKFPMPVVHEFLLAYHSLSGDETAKQAVLTTLDEMAKGGIYDQLGGGFARYSTDSVWKVPHFEKMLYDNGQLMSLYSHAYQLTGEKNYLRIIDETASFIQRELSHPKGGFYSSLDADSEGREGAFYVWKEKDISKAAGMDALAFKTYYNVSPFGNWPEEKDEEVNILYVTEAKETIAERLGYDMTRFEEMLARTRASLMEKRDKRERPGLDDKILTEWNALMITGLADAYQASGKTEYLQTARKAMKFVEGNLQRKEGGLYRSWKDGKAGTEAFAGDYAAMIQAYISLYEATFEADFLLKAKDLMDYTLAHFFDEATGLFFLTSNESEQLIARSRELSDNVIPAANSTLARGLFYLGQYFYETSYLDKSRQMLQNIAPNLERGAAATANWALLMTHMTYPFYEVAVMGPDAEAQRKELSQTYLPNALLMGGNEEGNLPLLQNKLLEGQTMIYVCVEKSCKLPVRTAEAALGQMRRNSE